ncbi:hypothetical protein L6164_024108 [Bauhinia variegata]|uniref:Uncharacterized protein n=1 Tax=Bauhinia variegata TaxID=167791 RepID=A0ACB9LWJ8_BAUVA|nr:hypothetical protein L6164_024108 [Bauhinia variegata]
MAPNPSNAEQPVDEQNVYKPSRDGLQRTVSDISFEICKEEHREDTSLAPISEVENAKCECCGMCEECTQEYISRVRDKFSGKLICGMCAVAVNEEMEKNGGKQREEALEKHMSACVKFNRLGRSYPVLYQAETIKEILKKSSRNRAKSISPRDNGQNKGGIARSSSCIPAITREFGAALRLSPPHSSTSFSSTSPDPSGMHV